MISYDPRGKTWDSWCALTSELFADSQLGVVPEEKWQNWGMAMLGVGNFAQSGVPDPRSFATWQLWAERMAGIMSVN